MTEHSFTEITVSPPGGTPATLRNIDELREWAGTEKQFWHRARSDASEISSRTTIPANLLVDHVASYQATATDAGLDRIRSSLQAYDMGSAIHSTSPVGRFVGELLDSEPEGPTQARAALLHLFRARGQHAAQTIPMVTGVAKALLFELGLGGALTAERKSLEDLGRAHTERLTEQAATFEGLIAAMETERTEAAAAAAEALATHGAALDAMSRETKEARVTQRRELDELVEVFRKKISIHAAADYWQNRRRSHSWFAWGFGLAGAFVGAGGTWLLYRFAKALFAPAAGSVAAALPPAWQIAAVVVMLSMVLWGVRLLVRLSLAHAHRNLDAAERVVMVHTYLALAKEGHLTADEDRKLILAALFRHSPSGLVRGDDAAPGTFYDLVSRMMAGRSG